MVTFESKDDVFALLIHLGYLSYDYNRREVSIPNEEIRREFRNAVEGNQWKTVVEAMEDSEKLLHATWKQEEETVAKAVAKIHRENILLLKYNDENSLSCVITLAYYSAMGEYMRWVCLTNPLRQTQNLVVISVSSWHCCLNCYGL